MSAPIIITVPNNYLAVDEDTKVVLEPASPAPSRKRRLDHLSWEEKMQRKKLKNRVAAQTSRDRKKAKMDEMESKIQELADRNDRLISEVESLKALNERLLSENAELRAARSVSGARGPAESTPRQQGAPSGTACGAPTPGDVSPLTDLLQHLESEEYLDTLHQLADSLFKEIDAGCSGAAQDVPVRDTGERAEGAEVVGPAAEHLEPSEGAVVDLKHDVNRILSQHSYAHPYTDAVEQTEQNDKGDIFYASLQENCVTVEVPCEEQVVEETQVDLDFTALTESAPIQVDTDFTSLTDGSISLDDMKMLSPMSLSPRSADENLLAVSPSHSFSDLGYDSMASPLSESESMDLSDFWCESFSELFPGLA